MSGTPDLALMPERSALRVVARNQFAPLLIANKEFTEHSWVRVTGVHPSQLSGIPLTGEPDVVPLGESSRTPDSASGERSVSSGPVAGTGLNVGNYIGGSNSAVQAGTVHGNIDQSERHRFDVDAEGVQIGDGSTQHIDRRRENAVMRAKASDQGRVYQAMRDQHITER
ncbi:hypothetical protein LZ318_25420 [Saccharopolyspora indica]|uniref:hypothetical protein n=1 Tax=Saccharopolyspora indica TaxID=1229659 RepID=UPI0022EB9E80|nr:hypothetical protein [Saccharopolyspora indica]MDA3646548.1 hypothetical protein [Saccharopolyspora indica]